MFWYLKFLLSPMLNLSLTVSGLMNCEIVTWRVYYTVAFLKVSWHSIKQIFFWNKVVDQWTAPQPAALLYIMYPKIQLRSYSGWCLCRFRAPLHPPMDQYTSLWLSNTHMHTHSKLLSSSGFGLHPRLSSNLFPLLDWFSCFALMTLDVQHPPHFFPLSFFLSFSLSH